ncbi:MAG: polysaccharide deacetylase [Bacteroidetes bacterium]|nr:polysaccharide deacetylase [Bacteroidota bacterium]
MKLIRFKLFVCLVILIAALSFSSCHRDPPIEDPTIALTFDDGPDSLYTLQILDILKAKNVKATFFLTGSHIRRYPLVVKRIVEEGHSAGNHTYSHLYISTSSDSLVNSEVATTQHLIDSICGSNPKLFRAPWGAITDEQVQRLRQQGYKHVSWNIDTRDFESTSEEIVKFVMEHHQDKGIVLMHSADYSDRQSRAETVKALPQIIDRLRSEYHYRFVRVEELLK